MRLRLVRALMWVSGSQLGPDRLGQHASRAAVHVNVAIGKHVLRHVLVIANEYLTRLCAWQDEVRLHLPAHDRVLNYKSVKHFHCAHSLIC